MGVPLVRRFQREIVHAKLFHAAGTCQTLVYVIDGDGDGDGDTVEAHCCVGVLVIKVLERAAGLTNNNSMSRTF